jgi:FecR-like protein
MTTLHLLATLPLAAGLWLPASPQGTPPSPAPQERKEAPPAAAPQEKKEPPPPKVDPLPEGQKQVLQALVISVDGKAEWKAAGAEKWKAAAVNDLLDPGAEIRTGLRSTLTLRVGKNATLVVDRASRVELPMIVQDGSVLRTRAAVHRGKVDFKVEAVGITSDFQVLTPSATLAVRGTGFTVEWGALLGVHVAGVDTNRVRAIELRYLAAMQEVPISGAGESSSAWPDPVAAALYRTVFPPPLDVDGKDLLTRGPGGYYGMIPRPSLYDVMRHETEMRNGGSDLGRSLGIVGPKGIRGR